MSESDITRLRVALARIEGDVRAIREDNRRGEEEHKDFEVRLRALERVRWLVAGACTLVGAGGGIGLTKFFS